MQTTIPLYGFGGVPYSAVRKAAPRNLLDNSDFRNPVNQRGITDASGRGVYTFDRWIIDSSDGNGHWDVKPNAGFGLNVNGDSWMTFCQKISGLDKTKTYTIAFQDGDGTIHINESADIQWQDDLAIFRIILNAYTMTVVWAALYEGSYTAETLPEYHPKGYGAELAECQRYLQRFRTSDLRKTYCEDFRPTMRMTDTGIVSTFEQSIDGVAYYFASADL